MSNILHRYWARQFAQYQVDDNRFLIPNFEHPLMSHDWQNKNFIGNDKDAQFDLGVLKVRGNDFINFKIQSLSQALQLDDYKDLLHDGFEEDLIPLLKFLADHGSHYVGLIYRDKQLICAATLGAAFPYGLLINAVIKKDYRGKNLTKEMMDMCHNMAFGLGIKKLCFWTKYPALLRYCDESYKYKIIQ